MRKNFEIPVLEITRINYFSTLISAFDKAKKKYQSKLKKLEAQMQSLTERYETQVIQIGDNGTQNLSFRG